MITDSWLVRISVAVGLLLGIACLCHAGGKTVGDVSDWKFMTAWQIKQLLPDEHVMIRTTEPIPEGWPQELRSIHSGQGEELSQVAWRWTPDGESWEYLEVFGYQVPVEDALPEVAIVFRRRAKKDTVAYVPIVYLEFDHEGVCESASKRWTKFSRKHGRFAE